LKRLVIVIEQQQPYAASHMGPEFGQARSKTVF
jgi:hypothetical protein